jgi:hypothetical protein
MKGTIVALIGIACFIAAIYLASRIDEERSVRALVRAAKAERARTHYVYDDVNLGDAPFIPPSARVRDMAQAREW